MNDAEIINLYIERSPNAIRETAERYGGYCRAIAMKILHNAEDADECVNDTYLNLWNNIPPQRPEKFAAFIGGVVRNLSIKRYKRLNAQKRGGDRSALLLSEIEACVPSASNVEEEADVNELARVIDDFLRTLRKEDRVYFVSRYSYGDSVPEIARQHGAGESKVKMSLHRTRKKLKQELERRGIL